MNQELYPFEELRYSSETDPAGRAGGCARVCWFWLFVCLFSLNSLCSSETLNARSTSDIFQHLVQCLENVCRVSLLVGGAPRYAGPQPTPALPLSTPGQHGVPNLPEETSPPPGNLWEEAEGIRTPGIKHRRNQSRRARQAEWCNAHTVGKLRDTANVHGCGKGTSVK